MRGQKLEKLLSNHEAQNKSGAIYGTIFVFLLSSFRVLSFHFCYGFLFGGDISFRKLPDLSLKGGGVNER